MCRGKYSAHGCNSSGGHGQSSSLAVTRGDEIVGVLRLSDGFKAICDEIKAAISEP